MIVSKYILL